MQARDWFGQPDTPGLAPFAHVRAWRDRVAAIGNGTSTEISAQDALASAKAAISTAVEQGYAGSGFSIGQSVTGRTEDPGANPVAGTLLRLTPRDIAVMRDDPQVGTVCVHFPRLGQVVMSA